MLFFVFKYFLLFYFSFFLGKHCFVLLLLTVCHGMIFLFPFSFSLSLSFKTDYLGCIKMVSWLKALFLDWSRGFKNSREILTLSQELSSLFLSLSITHTYTQDTYARTYTLMCIHIHTYTRAYTERERR